MRYWVLQSPGFGSFLQGFKDLPENQTQHPLGILWLLPGPLLKTSNSQLPNRLHMKPNRIEILCTIVGSNERYRGYPMSVNPNSPYIAIEFMVY